MRAPEQGDRDGVKADVRRVRRGHVALSAKDLDGPGEARQQTAQRQRQHHDAARVHAGISRRVRVGADGTHLETDRAAVQQPPDDGHDDQRDQDADVRFVACARIDDADQ